MVATGCFGRLFQPVGDNDSDDNGSSDCDVAMAVAVLCSFSCAACCDGMRLSRNSPYQYRLSTYSSVGGFNRGQEAVPAGCMAKRLVQPVGAITAGEMALRLET